MILTDEQRARLDAILARPEWGDLAPEPGESKFLAGLIALLVERVERLEASDEARSVHVLLGRPDPADLETLREQLERSPKGDHPEP